jgi:hypothetical protein
MRCARASIVFRLGVIDHGWGHVHFAETRGGRYVNPLRPGALEPYVDRIAPTIAAAAVAPDGRWQTAADFRGTLLVASRFGSVYAPGTRQNHEGQPCAYWFWLTRTWTPAGGGYSLQVRAVGTAGNEARADVELAVAGGTEAGS